MADLQAHEFSQLASVFSLGRITSVQRIWAGTVNTNYRVETDGNCFFLRINEGKSEEEVRYEISVLEFFVRHQVQAPLPKRSETGDRYYKFGELYISVFDWQSGHHVDSTTIDANHCERIGSALGTLHSCGHPPEMLHRESRYSESELRVRYANFSQASDPVLRPAIEAIHQEFRYLDSVSELRSSLPTGLIHADLFPDNVLLDDHEIVLLDFEQACVGAYIYDLAVVANAWCFGDSLRRDRFHALLEAYSRSSSVVVEAEDLLRELRASALRFLITRITDIYLEPGLSNSADKEDVKDFRRFLMRLLHWRQVDAIAFAEMAQRAVSS